MGKVKTSAQKILYAALFCGVVPWVLAWWARQLSAAVDLPIPNTPGLGVCLLIAGGALMLWAMLNLWQRGGGLPMNAFPPATYVSTGAYRWLRHPIYVGAALMCVGYFLWQQSAAGLWWVSPLFILLMVAYVIGFERERIAVQFKRQTHQPIIALPPNSDARLTRGEQGVVLVMVFGVWLLLYEVFVFMGLPQDVVYSECVWDAHLPRWDGAVLVYVALYPLTALLPFMLRTQQQARRLMLDGFAAMLLIYHLYLIIPAAVNYAAQPLEHAGFLGALIAWGKTSQGVAALPSFHVFWALLCARYYAEVFPRWRWLCALLAALIVLSCLLIASHSLLDVFFGVLAYVLVVRRVAIYRAGLRGAEWIANSWRQWRFGSLRLINHGFYAGVGGFFGFALMAYVLLEYVAAIYALGVSGFVGGGVVGAMVGRRLGVVASFWLLWQPARHGIYGRCVVSFLCAVDRSSAGCGSIGCLPSTVFWSRSLLDSRVLSW